MKKLTVNQIISLHDILIQKTGGSSGIRDINLLESAANSPFHTFECEDLYPTIECKAARLCFGIIKNHPFIDGNKRIGLLSMLTFLEINGIFLKYSDEELIKIGLNLASGKFTEKQLLSWIADHN